jgi:acetolactate synthase-1/2/3 large subunit
VLVNAAGVIRCDEEHDPHIIADAAAINLIGIMLARTAAKTKKVPIARVPYPIDLALEMLRDIEVLIHVGAEVPVAFFAYLGKPGRLVRDDCEVIELARIG